MPNVTVIDYRYPSRLPLDDDGEHVGPQLTDAFLALLQDCSGRTWQTARYVVDRTYPARRGVPEDGQTLGMHDVLHAHDLYGAGWSLLWGDGTLGGFEFVIGYPGSGLWLWPHVSTSNVDAARITRPLFCLIGNTERGLPEITHSFGHLVERVFERIDPAGCEAYLGYPLGKALNLPYNVDVPPTALPAANHGCIHFPPGARRHYDYSGEAGGQEGFLRRWLSSLPPTVWDALA